MKNDFGGSIANYTGVWNELSQQVSPPPSLCIGGEGGIFKAQRQNFCSIVGTWGLVGWGVGTVKNRYIPVDTLLERFPQIAWRQRAVKLGK